MSKYFTREAELYSSALFGLAEEKKASLKFLDELLKLKNIINKDSSIISMISAPIFAKKEQEQLLTKLAGSINLSEEIINFLYVLIQNNRFSFLPLIINHFEFLTNKQSGSKIVEVTLSEAVSDSEQKQIKQNLEKIFSANIEISFKEDNEILAGIIVKTENKMFDASLKTKFMNLTESVRKNVALL